MNYNCLIVDDEEDLAKTTAEYFRMFDVTTEYVCNSDACFDFFKNNTADLVLLDINLGDGSGFDVCKKLREDMQLPILFISASQSDDDVLIALSIGGDDYVKKPYSLSILLAKVKVNLNRIRQRANTDTEKVEDKDVKDVEVAQKDFYMDAATMSVVLKGERIALKAKEYALLNCLYEHHDTIVKKGVLFDEVWGDTFFSVSTLNVHIRKLREKIEEDPNKPNFIKTIWGTGYILELS